MIDVKKIADKKKCDRCGQSAKYMLTTSKDKLALCYRCVEYVLDTLQKARKE